METGAGLAGRRLPSGFPVYEDVLVTRITLELECQLYHMDENFLSSGVMSEWVNPPWNFSWVVRGELCACSWPDSEAQVRFLAREGVGHLVTLSREKQPPAGACQRAGIINTLIDVTEFEPPSTAQINKFIEICTIAKQEGKAVCVHCRMGRGRTGVMAACYLMRFCDLPPERAIINLRLMRPGSVETHSQEKAVKSYHDYLRSSK